MNKKDRIYLWLWLLSFGMTFNYVFNHYELEWVFLMGFTSFSMLLIVLYNDLAEYLTESEIKKNEK